LLIVFEGLDRCGKSTQCKKLLEFLMKQEYDVRVQRYPDRSEPTTGPLIDNFLKTAKSPYERPEEIHNLFAQNRKVLDTQLRNDILGGQIVIADRYSFSGIAYTAAKGVSVEFACSTEFGLLKPDLVIYLEADPLVTAKRAGFGDEAFEKTDYQLKVHKQMKALFNSDFWQEIDALQTIDEVHEDIKQCVLNTLENRRSAPLSSFTVSDFNQ